MLEDLIKALSNPFAEVGDQIADISVSSVKENFDVGGRPIKWEPSQRALRENNKTLVDTGALLDSIHSELSLNEVSVITNIEYAEAVNSEREFLLLQESDEEAIEEIIWKALGL